MKKLFIITIFFFYSCKTSNLIEVKSSYIARKKYDNYCNYLKFEIINHSNKDYYLSSEGNVKYLDKNNINITSTIDSLMFNYITVNQIYDNGSPFIEDKKGIHPVITYRVIMNSDNYRTQISKQVDEDFNNFILPHFENKSIDPKKLKEAKEEFTFIKYSNVILLEKNSSIIITKDLSPLIKRKTYDTIKVIYEYKTTPIIEDYDKTAYFLFPLNYLDRDNTKLVRIPSVYKKKFSNKYILIRNLISIDTLIIN